MPGRYLWLFLLPCEGISFLKPEDEIKNSITFKRESHKVSFLKDGVRQKPLRSTFHLAEGLDLQPMLCQSDVLLFAASV